MIGYNKGKRYGATILLIIAMCFISVTLCACSGSAFSKVNVQAFFNDLSMVAKSKEEIEVRNVTGYYQDNSYFYDVDYSFYNKFTDDWVSLRKVKVFRGSLYDLEFNDETGPKDHAYTYEKYLKAKAEGEKKEFSKQEIEKYISNYFSSKG